MWRRVLLPPLLGILAGTLIAHGQLLAGLLGPDFTTFRLWPATLSLTVMLVGVCLLGATITLPKVAQETMRYKELAFVALLTLALHTNAASLGRLDPSELVVMAFTIVLFVSLLGPAPPRLTASLLNALNGLLFLAILLSLPNDFNPVAMLKSLKMFLAAFLVINFIRRRSVEQVFADALIVTGIVFGLIACIQTATWVLAQIPLSLVDDSQLEDMFEQTPYGPVLRAHGLMLSYRSFAMVLGVSICIAIARLLFDQSLSSGRRRLAHASLLIMPLAVLLTLSKDVSLGLMLALPMLFILHKPARIAGFAVFAVLIAFAGSVALVILPQNFERLVTVTKSIPAMDKDRLSLDRKGLEWFIHGPYQTFGRGIGAGSKYTAHTKGWPAHNSLILVADELGLVGLTVLLAIYAWVTWRVLLINMLARAPPDIALARGLAAALLVVFVGTQFEASYLDVFIWTFFAVIEATALRLVPRYHADGARISPHGD